MDLSNYIGQNIKIRFRLKSDGFVNEDGFYFDDLSVNTISASTGTKMFDESNFNQLSIYPNPAQNKVTIESNDLLNSIEILNSTGALIYKTNSSDLKYQINTDNWAEGIYLVKVTCKNGKVTGERLLINK
jgi:hypothetical protein